MAENSDKQQKRKPRGRPFPKGVSGNPGGRPKGFPSLIRERTRDGEELIDIALAVARGETTIAADDNEEGVIQVPTVRERMDAVKWLGSYAGGLPTQAVEVTGEAGGPLVVQVVNYAGEGE